MTREEAITRIKDHIEVHSLKEKRAIKITQALNMAIEVLEASKWHYPSKGELPPSGEEVLCWLWGTTPDVGCWNEEDELWHFDEFEEETIDCWQYIYPPKEEA